MSLKKICDEILLANKGLENDIPLKFLETYLPNELAKTIKLKR